MAHSPGPWKTEPINYADVYSADGELVALIVKRFTKPDTKDLPVPTDETIDNARLVRSAPDLYRTLDNLLISIGRRMPNPYGHDCQWCGACCDRAMNEAVSAIELAGGC